MKISHDTSVDAAYIYIAERIEPGGVATTYTCDPIEVRGQIHLDFDANGVVLGIEILDASKKLPRHLLETYRTRKGGT